MFDRRATIVSIKFSAMTLATAAAGIISYSGTAEAVPSFARQTGQPCATCHTAFPELTPFGRQFKLSGYTAGGTRCYDRGNPSLKEGKATASDEVQIPLAMMVNPTFTHMKKKNTQEYAAENTPRFDTNNNWVVQETSLFVAGQMYCNVGAFIQTTYDGVGRVMALDNTDIRYTHTSRLAGLDVLFGITANDRPTVQDVWNSTPVWSFPFTSSALANGPSVSTLIEGDVGANRVAGTSAYVWIDRTFYAEVGGYHRLSNATLNKIGVDPADGTAKLDNFAPYWRFAMEKTWDQNSLMIGTFGMMAKLVPTDGGAVVPGVRDSYTDIGVDAQYQYLGEVHGFTVRASYIWEHQKLVPGGPDRAASPAARSSEDLRSFKASASYIYDRTISVTGGYFSLTGTTDQWTDSGTGELMSYWGTATGSPNSSGWVADIAYLPFSHGGPSAYPWMNARIGLSYTHYDKFDGASTSYSDPTGGTGRNAKDNDTVYFYTWVAF